jgi:hypothetical protein
MQQSPGVRNFILQALNEGGLVALDLRSCDYLDSTFLGCLAILAARGQTKFQVIADAKTRERLFSATHLGKILALSDQAPRPVSRALPLPCVSLEREDFGRHLLEAHEELAKCGGPGAAAFAAVAQQLAREVKPFNFADTIALDPPEHPA